MRRWLFVLLIVLLPLRGWMGEAMAAQMAAQSHAPAGAAAHTAAGDCAGHHADAEAAAPSVLQGSQQAMEAGCAACQACSTMALAFSHAPIPAPVFGTAPPVQSAVIFASAEPAPADKPPIS